jgi:hypothetical protein
VACLRETTGSLMHRSHSSVLLEEGEKRRDQRGKRDGHEERNVFGRE